MPGSPRPAPAGKQRRNRASSSRVRQVRWAHSGSVRPPHAEAYLLPHVLPGDARQVAGPQTSWRASVRPGAQANPRPSAQPACRPCAVLLGATRNASSAVTLTAMARHGCLASMPTSSLPRPRRGHFPFAVAWGHDRHAATTRLCPIYARRLRSQLTESGGPCYNPSESSVPTAGKGRSRRQRRVQRAGPGESRHRAATERRPGAARPMPPPWIRPPRARRGAPVSAR